MGAAVYGCPDDPELDLCEHSCVDDPDLDLCADDDYPDDDDDHDDHDHDDDEEHDVSQASLSGEMAKTCAVVLAIAGLSSSWSTCCASMRQCSKQRVALDA